MSFDLKDILSVDGKKKTRKRSLGTRDKQILLERAGYKCEACGRKLTYAEMNVGHKHKAWSKGGATNLRNSACLCYKCNKLQGTDSWSTFMKKLGKSPKSSTSKKTKKTPTKRRKKKKDDDPFAGVLDAPKPR
jgi:5-methylcytosine-specific restriction endonuclease McrA